MFGTIFAIIILLGCLIGASFLKDKKYRSGEVLSYKGARLGIRLGGIILALIIILLSCFTQVQTGHTGIPVKFGQVQNYTMESGLNWHSPFISVVEMDNREQRYHFELLAFSADLQEVQVKGSVNYCIDSTKAMTLYKTVGVNYENILIVPRTQEAVKSTFGDYTAEGLIENRSVLSENIGAVLNADLSKSGINVISISIEDIDFTDAFTQAVEAKQVATQEKLRAQTEQERLTMEAEAKAKRDVINANAEAEKAKIAAEADLEVTKIQADAAEYAGQKEAAKNKAISEWLTPDLLYYYWVQQWDGKVPTVATDNMMPILNIGEVKGND
jgi:regulator of protease activity HflC (stomatin/prohibitin superfamily)